MIVQERWIWVLVVLVLTPYVFGQPVWDDHILLTEGLWNDASIWKIWMNPVQGGEVATQYYRPVSMTLMALLPHPILLHFVALMTHVGSALLLRMVVQELNISPQWAIMAGVLFALHPVHVEPLGWMSCIPDILAVHFGLWSLRFAIQSNLMWMMVSLLLGVLSKEIALLPVLGWLVIHHRERQLWGGVLIVSLMVLVLRSILGIHTQWVSIGQMAEVSWRTIGMGVWGWWLPIEHYPVRDLWSVPTWQPSFGWFLLLSVGWILRHQWNWVLVSMGAMILSLPPIWAGYLAAERYLYMASIGWIVAMVYWMSERLEMRTLKMSMVLLFCVAPIHFLRAHIWSTDETLFDHATQVLPNSGYAWHLRGMVALRANEVEASIGYFERAVQCERPHYMDRELVLQGLIHTKQFSKAFQWAEAGPKEGLSKVYLELWLDAARQQEQKVRIQDLEKILYP